MMSYGGFIFLARKIEQEGGTFKYCRNNDERWMFIKSLLRANFQDVIVNGIELKRGQFLTSRTNFAKETDSSEWKVRIFWNKFQRLGFLTRKPTNKYTIITVLNYDRYQKIGNYFGKKSPARPPTDRQQTTTDKTYKKGEGINNKDIHEVFAYFLLKTQKTYKLTADRRSIIEGRLKEGRTVEEIKRAIDNFVLDEWEGRGKYIDIIYCIGNQKGKGDNLDKWLAFKPPATAKEGGFFNHGK